MKCLSCYKIQPGDGYCYACRKRLFANKQMSAVLPFTAPKSANFSGYQQHTKQLSISGAQLKYSLAITGNTLQLTDENGIYILKPVPPSKHLELVGDIPENEHITMQMAAQLFGIKTADNTLVYFQDGEPAYITKRFDRRAEGGKYLQEDFAQLSARSKFTHGEGYKYDGSYEEIGILLKRFVAASIPALERFFAIVVFNYIISNGDAHLKNFSLIRTDAGEYQLTPAYDLMCTVLHTPMESDTALDLYADDMNGHYYSTYGHYGRESFLELAHRLGIQAKRAEKLIDTFLSKQLVMTGFVNESFLSEQAKLLYIKNFTDKIQRLR